jgi:hypothetical protein
LARSQDIVSEWSHISTVVSVGHCKDPK